MAEAEKIIESSNKILVVDDDPDFCEVAKFHLEQILDKKYELEFAENGIEAVEKFDKYHPKITVLDIILPQKSGFLVLEHIKKITKENPSYVIMVTAHQGRRHRQYAENLGANEYLVKPFKMEELARIVKIYMEK